MLDRASSVVVIAVVVAGGVFFVTHWVFIVSTEENVLFAINPTADRAFTYGERHFSSSNSAYYDIARAQYFFEKTVAIDPKYPYAEHELARIAFLQGNFPVALNRINVELSEHPKDEPNSYYVRALILGYMGKYGKSATDYETYFKLAPANWAGINDYSWVLLKANRPEDALAALDWGLQLWPTNPWLLNNKATALYELKRYNEASLAAAGAAESVTVMTAQDWLFAYPGNDPGIADMGVSSFKKSVADNQRMVQTALAAATQSN
jgi:tetratricopeptide (TPR) repeat protein